MPKRLSLRLAAINSNDLSKQALNFRLSQPSGPLSAFVQGIWSASVSELQADSVVKPLYSDGGSGILFNLGTGVLIDNEPLPEGVIMLPVKKIAENITLSPGAKLAGIRFLPAIGYRVLGHHYNKPTLLSPKIDHRYNLYRVCSDLRSQNNNEALIETLYYWANDYLNFTNVIPSPLARALECIEQKEAPGQLNISFELSQRQIERLFKLWLGITPKYYQRILRIKKAICFLQIHKQAKLVDVAQQFGFSDQAHMTREFRAIACITPAKI